MDIPRTEAILLEMWTKVFKTDEISVTDDFFDLGGHSLLAAQLTTDIRETFDIELSLLAFFDHPTISELGEVIHRLEKSKGISAKSVH